MSDSEKRHLSRRDFVQLLAAGAVPVVTRGTGWARAAEGSPSDLPQEKRNRTWPVLTTYSGENPSLGGTVLASANETLHRRALEVINT